MNLLSKEANLDLIHEDCRSIPVIRKVDVLIGGGGVAGVAAALAAAREGASVMLIEKNNCLGGAGTAGLVVQFGGIPYSTMSGLSKEIIDRLVKIEGASIGPRTPFDPEALKQVFFDMLQEAHVELRLYTSVVEAYIKENKISGLVIESKSGRQAILANVVIDCTGDADIAYYARVPFIKGREDDGKMRPVSLMFRMGNINLKRVVSYAESHPDSFSPDPNYHFIDLDHGLVRLVGFFEHVKEAREKGELPPNCHYMRLEGVVAKNSIGVINCGRTYDIDGTDVESLTNGEILARKEIQVLVRFIKKYIPGFENSFLVDTGSNIGVRETRRICGKYILTEDDIANGKDFEDTIAYQEAMIPLKHDTHSPDPGEGKETDSTYRSLTWKLKGHHIPYRSLLPKDCEGLLVAGRCISVTHNADNFTRNMPECIATGQAAGTAAAIASREEIAPDKINVNMIQKSLLEQGVRLASTRKMD